MDTIEGMRTFASVVSAGSFTGAADRLDMSSALVSKYIGQLEERLSVRLLNRTTRSLSLTDVGRVYHERCVQLLEEFDELEDAVQDTQTEPKGKLVVSAPTTFGESYLTPAAAEFLKEHPGIRLDLHLSDRFVGLADEGFDLAIRIGELPDSALIARRLAPARVVACATPGYLKRKGTPRHPAELVRHDCIMDTNYHTGPQWPFAIDGKRITIKVNGRFLVNSARATRVMALTGAGIGLCPLFAVGDAVKTGQLRIVLDEFEAFDLGIYAVYLQSRHLAANVRVFVDFLIKHFSTTREWEQ